MGLSIYARENRLVFFILPTLAAGFDEECGWFLEAAWLSFVVGLSAEKGSQ